MAAERIARRRTTGSGPSALAGGPANPVPTPLAGGSASLAPTPLTGGSASPAPTPVRHPWLVFIWFWLFAALSAGGVFLGLSEHGRALVPGAIALWAPAGVLLMAAAGTALRNRSALLGKADKARRDGLGALVAGLGMFGGGMARLTNGPAWRVLALPAIVTIGALFLRELPRRPSRSGLFSGIRRRSGELRMWTAYLGAWVIVLVTPVGVAWSLGLITVR